MQSPSVPPAISTPQNRSSTTTPARRSIFSSLSRPGSAVTSPVPGSASTAASPVACSICLSPIRKGSKRSLAAATFKTQCCHQLFHKSCMQRHKEQCSSPSHPRACPLCRSVAPTGLTPYRPPAAPTLPGAGGGGSFVSGLALHSEMRRRVSAARNAVARSLAARTAAAAEASALAHAPAVATTGAASTDAPPVSAPSPHQNIFFTSPGAAYNAVRAQQFESRMAQEGDGMEQSEEPSDTFAGLG